MSEQVKAVLRELNSALGSKLDLIALDSLGDAQRLQLLLDLLAHYGAGPKMEVGAEEPETVSLQLLEMLSNVKYRPPPSAGDPRAFRTALLAAEPALLLSILTWLVTHKEQVLNNAYLAKYLKAPDIPTEVARAGGMAELIEQHRQLVEEFKEVHRRSRLLEAENTGAGGEMVQDIKEMAVERDIVMKRLESAHVHLPEASRRDALLAASRELRVRQQRAAELASQHELQENQLKSIGDQLKWYLNVLYGQSSAPRTFGDVTKHLREQIQLNEYLAREKLPAECSALQQELLILRQVAAQGDVTRDHLTSVRDKVSAAQQAAESLVAERLASRQPAEDKLKPFRQQAALIRRNRDAAVERVRALAQQLRDHEATLAELNAQVRQLLGDAVLRGEDLKKYVAGLRNKSTLYKRQRASLAACKVEAGILTRTLQLLSSADPTLELALLNHNKLQIEELGAGAVPEDVPDLAKRSLHHLSQMVAQTAQQLAEVRQEVQPLSERIKPIRTKFQTVQQQYEQKKRVYEATSINITSQMAPLKEKVEKLKDELRVKEEEWKNLRQKITKAESMQEVVAAEIKNSMLSPRRPSKMESLQRKAREMEATIRSLEEKQQVLSSRSGAAEQQNQHWKHVLSLLECKLAAAARSRSAARALRDRLTITKQSQTLTIQ